jgi:hypothetical protein
MTSSAVRAFPVFLHSYSLLKDHLEGEFQDLTNVERGKVFAEFVSEIVPLSTFGSQFEKPLISEKHSHDHGVDLEAHSADGTKTLYIQSKLTIRTADDIDQIISKFDSYYQSIHPIKMLQSTLFDSPAGSNTTDVYFMIVTLSDIQSGILPAYERSRRSSRTFYKKIVDSGRFNVLDGPLVLPILQGAYRQMYVVPSNLELHLDSPPLHKGNVYIGIISSEEITKCYTEFGDALFIENVRDFLGEASGKRTVDKERENVNKAITDTAKNEPEKMLARNNGITIRAKKVSVKDGHTLRLENASIVNGCQTTMCLVDQPGAFLLVKIVETSDSWDIAKAANFQNRVEQIDLELARYIRPQLVKSAASKMGKRVEHGTYNSVFDVFRSVHRDRVAYEEIYHLFIGLFSKDPNNVIATNYTELRSDILKDLQSDGYAQEDKFDTVFDVLFKLYESSQLGQEAVMNKYNDRSYKDVFQRFWKVNKSNYRSILAILAACGSIRMNIYDGSVTLDRMGIFLDQLRALLENDRDRFVRYYQYAFQVIAMEVIGSKRDETEMLRFMYDQLRHSNFDGLYMKVCVVADGVETK